MRATVEVYESNAGGVCVAVFGQNGLKKLFAVRIPCNDDDRVEFTKTFYQEAQYGCPSMDEDEYNAEDFSGLSMDDAYTDSCNSNLIDEF